MKSKNKFLAIWFTVLLLLNGLCLFNSCKMENIAGTAMNGIAVGMDVACLGYTLAICAVEEKKK